MKALICCATLSVGIDTERQALLWKQRPLLFTSRTRHGSSNAGVSNDSEGLSQVFAGDDAELDGEEWQPFEASKKWPPSEQAPQAET